MPYKLSYGRYVQKWLSRSDVQGRIPLEKAPRSIELFHYFLLGCDARAAHELRLATEAAAQSDTDRVRSVSQEIPAPTATPIFTKNLGRPISRSKSLRTKKKVASI